MMRGGLGILGGWTGGGGLRLTGWFGREIGGDAVVRIAVRRSEDYICMVGRAWWTSVKIRF